MFGISRARPMPGEPDESAESPSEGRQRSGGTSRWLRAVLAVVLVALVGAGAYVVYTRFIAPPAPVAAPQTFAARKGTITSAISSTGTVATQNQAKLSFPTSGSGSTNVVTDVLVKVGDSVTGGQELAKLDSSTLVLAVTQTQASLMAAQTKLDTIEAGPIQADVASTQVAVTNAQANLDKVKAGATSADVASAESAVASAMSQVQTTRTNLTKLKAGAASLDIKNAELAISQAQLNYNQAVADKNAICAGVSATPPTATATQCTAAKYKVTSASYAITSAKNALAKLKTPASSTEIAAAKASVTAAENNYNSAVAKLNDLKASPSAADLAAAEAQLAAAQNNLAKVQNPYTDADVQSAEAAVAQAQANLDTAKANLANATLKAPFDGTVSAVAIAVGEAPASPAITVIDPKHLKVDLSVDESDISNVKAGQKVAITTDSVTGRTWQGLVNTVAPTATIQSGVALYAVSVTVSDGTGLKLGMTGNASVVIAEHQNVLLVPNRAIQSQGRNRVVQVMVDGDAQPRVVTVGISNDQWTEITEGLAEGDQVVIPTTTTTTTSTTGQNNLRRDSTFGTGGAVFGGGPPSGGPGR